MEYLYDIRYMIIYPTFTSIMYFNLLNLWYFILTWKIFCNFNDWFLDTSVNVAPLQFLGIMIIITRIIPKNLETAHIFSNLDSNFGGFQTSFRISKIKFYPPIQHQNQRYASKLFIKVISVYEQCTSKWSENSGNPVV